MSGPGPIVVHPTGSLTAPDSIRPTVSSALAAVLSRATPVDVAYFQSGRIVALSDGVDFQYHLLDAVQYLTGPKAPYTAPTVASTSQRATGAITFTAATNPNNNDTITIEGRLFTFKTTLSAYSGTALFEIKLGGGVGGATTAGNLAITIANIQKLIMGTGTNGTEFNYYPNPFLSQTYDTDQPNFTATVTSTTATVVNIRAKIYGTAGNSSVSYLEGTDGGGTWSVTSLSGGATGTITGSGPLAGDYTYGYCNVRKADGAATGISNLTEISISDKADTTISSPDTPAARDGMDLYRLFRTTDAGSELLRVTDSSSAPITDNKSDDVIDTGNNIVYDETIQRSSALGYPVRYRCHAMHLGCLFGAGAYLHAKQNSGTANVTNGSRSVTLSAGIPTAAWIGRSFRATADDDRYLIVEVDTASRVVTLSIPYVGATNATAAYEVTDDRDPFRLYYTEPLLINNWPDESDLEGVVSEDARGVTAMRSAWGSLVVLTMSGSWRVLGTPDTNFRVMPQTEASGCYTNRALVDVRGSLMWLGPSGVMLWNGEGNPINLSMPPVSQGEDPTGIADTLSRINPLAVDGIVGDYNGDLGIVRWAVPVDGSPFNNFWIVYNIQTGGFTFGRCDGITSLESIVGPEGSYVTVAGDIYGRLWLLDQGTSDGAWGFECVQLVSAYTASTKTASVSGTPFPTTLGGLMGVPCLHVAPDGTIQRLTIASNTSSTITFVSPPSTALGVGSQIVIGGIYWRMVTSDFSSGEPRIRKTLSSLVLHYVQQDAGQIWFAASYDGRDTLCHFLMAGGVDYADLSVARGTKYFEMRRGPGRTNRVELFALAPGFDVTIVGIEASFRTRDEVLR